MLKKRENFQGGRVSDSVNLILRVVVCFGSFDLAHAAKPQPRRRRTMHYEDGEEHEGEKLDFAPEGRKKKSISS
jgi:hypothetical protein